MRSLRPPGLFRLKQFSTETPVPEGLSGLQTARVDGCYLPVAHSSARHCRVRFCEHAALYDGKQYFCFLCTSSLRCVHRLRRVLLRDCCTVL